MMAHLSAVTLVVPDYDTAIAFYVGALGFELLEDTRLSETKRWVRVAPSRGGPAPAGSIDPGDRLKPTEAPAGAGAETALLLARADGPAQEAAIGNQTGGRVAFFLEVDDFDVHHAHFKKMGVHFLETPRDEPYGKVAVFEDPFGNRWDLIQPAR
ncbi:MAG: VOC family protein [Pseudomonadota bacterium]